MLAHAYKTTSRAALRGCADDAQIARVCFSKIMPSAAFLRILSFSGFSTTVHSQ